jgi:argonaute-like protein implicated in RNA metabolism and viral defense
MEENIFRSKDMDLIAFLRFRGFKPLRLEDNHGVRWVVFETSPIMDQAIGYFLAGCVESDLLHAYRSTRKFMLDSMPGKRTE